MGNLFEDQSFVNNVKNEKDVFLKDKAKAVVLAGLVGMSPLVNAETGGNHPSIDTPHTETSHKLRLSEPEDQQSRIEKSYSSSESQQSKIARFQLQLDQQIRELAQQKTQPEVEDHGNKESSLEEIGDAINAKKSPDTTVAHNRPITFDTISRVTEQVADGVGVNAAFDSVRSDLSQFAGINNEDNNIQKLEGSFDEITGDDALKNAGNIMLAATLDMVKNRATNQVNTMLLKSLRNSAKMTTDTEASFALDDRNAKNMYFNETLHTDDGGTVTIGADVDALSSKQNPRIGVTFDQKF